MTPADLSALSALADAATPGPWRDRPESGKVAKRHGWHTIIDERGVPVVQTGFVEIHPGDGEESYAEAGVRMRPEDRAFIASARTAVPSLLAHVAAQAERIEALEGALREASRFRERCHAHDDDMGHPRRPFDDAESWDLMESMARRVLGGKEG